MPWCVVLFVVAFFCLVERLDAFQANRAKSAGPFGAQKAMGDGYRIIAELIGGVLCGAAVGWLVDTYAGLHTRPWGIAVGIAVGAGASVYLAARTAQRMGAKALAESGMPPAVASDDDDD